LGSDNEHTLEVPDEDDDRNAFLKFKLMQGSNAQDIKRERVLPFI